LIPLIFACTSEIIDDHLQNIIMETGFNGMYEAPIKEAIIKNEILPKLILRE
jgi:hypothetical protein